MNYMKDLNKNKIVKFERYVEPSPKPPPCPVNFVSLNKVWSDEERKKLKDIMDLMRFFYLSLMSSKVEAEPIVLDFKVEAEPTVPTVQTVAQTVAHYTPLHYTPPQWDTSTCDWTFTRDTQILVIGEKSNG